MGIMIVGVATQGIAAKITAIQITERAICGKPRTAVIKVSTKLEMPSAIATGTVRIADACWKSRNASGGINPQVA